MKRNQYVLQSCVIAVLAAIALPIGVAAAYAEGYATANSSNGLVIKQ